MRRFTIHTQGAVAFAMLLHASAHAQTSGQEIYGQLSFGLNFRSGVAAAPAKDITDSPISASYFGFRGCEDLGGGIRAVFRLESSLAIDSGAPGGVQASAGKFFNRQSYAGLVLGRAGTITLGRQFHASADRVIRTLDPQAAAGNFAYVPIGVFGVNRFAGNDTRVDNSVKYRFAGSTGFEAGVSHGFGDAASGASDSVDVAVDTGTFKLGAAAVDYAAPTAVAATGRRPHHKAWTFGGQVPAGAFVFYANVIRSELDARTAGLGRQDNRIVTLGLECTQGNQRYRAVAYLDRGSTLNGVAGRDGNKTTWLFTAEHMLSKRTSLFAGIVENRFSGGYLFETLNLTALGRSPSRSAVRMLSFGMQQRF